MRALHSTAERKIRNGWYVNPVVWAAIAALSFILAPNWRDLLAGPAQGQQQGLGTELKAAPAASVDETSVPAASSVFTQPSYLPVEHVEAF